jgi:hypothetical protein
MIFLKFFIPLLFVSLSFSVCAQSSITTEKQALIDRVLSLWSVENLALAMAQRPAIEVMQQSRAALQGRVTAQKQEVVLKELATEVQKFLDDITPVVSQAAQQSKPQTLPPLLDKHFSETELRQLIELLESPIKKKFESLAPELEKTFGENLAAKAGPVINPKLEALSKSISLKLRAAALAPQ